MSTDTRTLPRVDWPAFFQHATSRESSQLALVMLGLLLIPLAALPLDVSVSLPEVAYADSTTGQAINGGLVAGWIVVESLAILALVKLRRWLDVGLLSTMWAIAIVFHLSVGVLFVHLSGEVPWHYFIVPYAGGALAGLVMVAYLLVHVELEYRMLWWLVHNLLAMGLAVGLTVVVGTALTPVMVAAVLALLVVWDIVAVKYTDIMAELLDSTNSIFLPNYIILSNRWRVDYWALLEYINDERRSAPPSVDTVLGLGDIVFPGALVLALAEAGQPAVGIAVALGVAAAFMLMTGYQHAFKRGMLPALPWAAAGAAAGYLLARPLTARIPEVVAT